MGMDAENDGVHEEKPAIREEYDYVIWSAEHQAWWKDGCRGYSKGFLEAGRYTRSQAMRICRDAIPTSGHLGWCSEMPVRREDVVEFTKGSMMPGPFMKGPQ